MTTAAELREALEVWRIEDPLRNDGMLLAIIGAARERLAQLEADPELRARLLRAITGIYDDIAIVDAVLAALITTDGEVPEAIEPGN